MSIWSTITTRTNYTEPGPLDDIPERDNYTGEPDGACVYSIDLATAVSWHDCIRFVAEERDHNQRIQLTGEYTIPKTTNYIECLLTVDEARELIADLEAAVGYIEARKAKENP